MAELIPAPFPHLLRRLVRELEREGKAFDLPARRFWTPPSDLDLSVSFHGRPAQNPVGPAAGPQDQLAQNIVLAWLAGSRILELKTVQINDRLVIPRPCIDATTVGYNVEWSQELRLEHSLREYAAGSMLIDVLRQGGLLGRDASADHTILDMSVGYDLAGIRSPRVRAWIAGLKDASGVVAGLRAQIPPDLAGWGDVAFTRTLSDQITLSTFHGCPAAEIFGIAEFLLTEMDVHVTVKLNPTLLGRSTVDGLLHDVLGYTEVRTRAADFAHDLQWSEALEIADRLTEVARARGRTFHVKFSNTLVVRNHRSFFPASEPVMYLSGEPLHVLTLNLVDRWRRARPHVPISFSAGIDNQNFPDAVALGFVPVTTCTDLLRPGGYARLPAYLERLQDRMRALGVRRIPDYVVKAAGQGGAAIDDVVSDPGLRAALHAEVGAASCDLAAVLARHGRADLEGPLVRRAAVLNTPILVARATADPRYRAAHRSAPRKISSRLHLLDCINCDKCVPVCPNDANFVYEVTPFRCAFPRWVVQAGQAVETAGGVFEARKGHQLANFADFCNECGNCDVFCPEDGGPYIEKPRFFGSFEAMDAPPRRDGFALVRAGAVDTVRLRQGGREYELRVDRATDRGAFTDGRLDVEVAHSERRPLEVRVRPGTSDGHVLDFAACLNMAVVVDGVLDTRRANPVNAPWL